MKAKIAALLLCLGPAAGAAASGAIEAPPMGREVEIRTAAQDDLSRRVAQELAEDEQAAATLAKRILRSKLRDALFSSADPATTLAALTRWVQEHPEAAANLAIGFARDDALGSDDFETSIFTRVQSMFDVNPERYQGLFGGLDAAAKESAQLSAELMGDDETRQALQRFFDGETADAKVPRPRSLSGGLGAAPPPPAAARGRLGDRYDRLSAANPTGYSPEVLAYQNAMNAQRPPGSPRLAESGHLDHATLRHPYHALRHDIDALEKSLKRHASVAKEGMGPGKTFADRRRYLEAARKALAEFDAEAEKGKDPKKITPRLLAALAAKRREAARWISAAALAEQLAVLLSWEGFLTPELSGIVRKLGLDKDLKTRYLDQGRRLDPALALAIAEARRALALLEAGGAALDDPALGGLMERARLASHSLPARLQEFVETPKWLLARQRNVSRLRAFIERWILRLFPGTAYARRLRRSIQEERSLADAFVRIANTPV